MKACIWDMDGVIADTGYYHFLSWRETLKEYGVDLKESDFKKTFGMRNEEIVEIVFGDLSKVGEIAEKKERKYRELARGKINLLPGVGKLLDGLRARGWKQALASSTPLENIKLIVNETGIASFFEVIISGEDVKKGKPDPEVFLKTSQKLGVNPENCVVIEDAPAGIKAANSAGMRCIGVATTHGEDKLKEANLVVRTLESVTPDVLEGLWK